MYIQDFHTSYSGTEINFLGILIIQEYNYMFKDMPMCTCCRFAASWKHPWERFQIFTFHLNFHIITPKDQFVTWSIGIIPTSHYALWSPSSFTFTSASLLSFSTLSSRSLFSSFISTRFLHPFKNDSTLDSDTAVAGTASGRLKYRPPWGSLAD